MLETMTPMLRLRAPARTRACRLGLYFSSLAALRTRLRVEPFTPAVSFRTREAVAVDTPARRATSRKVMPAIFSCGPAASRRAAKPPAHGRYRPGTVSLATWPRQYVNA